MHILGYTWFIVIIFGEMSKMAEYFLENMSGASLWWVQVQIQFVVTCATLCMPFRIRLELLKEMQISTLLLKWSIHLGLTED